MEDRLRPKTSTLYKKSVAINSRNPSKSSKTSPLHTKIKTPHQSHLQITSLKDSNRKLQIQQSDANIKPLNPGPHHRRIKSDPVPNSPYSLNTKPTKVNPSIKKSNNSTIKPIKGHRRTHSDNENLKKTLSKASIDVNTEEKDREKLIEAIKNCSIANLPMTTTLDFYKLGKPLGKGAFGKVYLGIHKLSGLRVAIKTIEKSYMQDERTRKKVFQEVYIMNKIHDKNVIRLLELFESPRHLMIVLEYAGGGDLLQLLRARGRLTEQEARPIFKQIIDAVIACHKEDIIHRDIKLDNILLNEEMTLIKLCDFGVSRIAKSGFKINEQCGTPAYLAPEIIVNEGYEPFFVDV